MIVWGGLLEAAMSVAIERFGVLGREEDATVSRFGFSGPILEVPADRKHVWFLPEGWRLSHCGMRNGVELLLSEGAARKGALRRWVLCLGRRAPSRRFLHLHRGPDGVEQLGIVRPGLFDRANVCVRSVSSDLWLEFDEIDETGRDHLAFLVADVLDREQLTKRFFRTFRKHLLTLEGGWRGSTVALDQYQRRDLTMALLCRLMFVTFLARERGIDGRRNYWRWLLEQPRDGDVLISMLRPLFFGALNCPLEERGPEAKKLGALPFLNGGLFQPLSLEEAQPGLTLPDDMLCEAIHELFERFEFTSREIGARGSAIDPEMLGQVFEALMHADERRRSGSFYTPPRLVDRFVHEALVEAARQVDQMASSWVSCCLSGNGAPPDLSVPRKKRLEELLCNIRILDPAVGSGAFLLSALEAVVELRTGLRPERGRHQVRREAIATNLFGVDTKVGAVRLCELRLWLSLLADAPAEEPLQPLPNLDHHIRQGDSLNEPLSDLITARQLGESVTDMSFAGLHGADKQAAIVARRRDELARHKVLVEAAARRVQRASEELQQLASTPDLFGETKPLSKRHRQIQARLEVEHDQLLETERALERGELPYFSYPAAFPEAFAKGGFDLIVGNPPWVRIHDVPLEQRQRLKSRYRVCRGGGSGFSQQVDLSVPFVERALELTKPGGLVGLLLPSKVFTAQYGRVLRRMLLQEHQPIHFADLSRARTGYFDASNYPSWVLVRGHDRRPSSCRVSRSRASDEIEVFDIERHRLSLVGGSSGPWVPLAPSERAVMDDMRAGGVTLGDYGLRARLGVKTGCNRVFLTRSWERFDDDTVTLEMYDGARLTVPDEWAPFVSRGRDIRSFATEGVVRALIPYDRGTLTPAPSLPPDLEGYFEEHRDELESRSDAGNGKLWTVFRTQGLRRSHRVIWRDISTRLETVYVGPDDDAVPLNTCYFAQVKDEEEALLITALLNSTPVRNFAAVIAEPAMSGHSRFFGWTIEQIPWPKRLRPGSDEARRLVECSLRAHREGADSWQDEIDAIVARAYGLEAKTAVGR